MSQRDDDVASHGTSIKVPHRCFLINHEQAENTTQKTAPDQELANLGNGHFVLSLQPRPDYKPKNHEEED